MVLVMEMIIGCILFTIMVIWGNKKNSLSGLHNMPMALQKRVASLTQYQDVKVVHTKERILKKIPALIVLAIIFVVLIYASGARTFIQGFVNAFLIQLIKGSEQIIYIRHAVFPEKIYKRIHRVL